MSLQQLHHYKLKFIILNSYEHLKLIEFSPKINQVKSFRTDCSSDFYVSFQCFSHAYHYIHLLMQVNPFNVRPLIIYFILSNKLINIPNHFHGGNCVRGNMFNSVVPGLH